MTDEDALLRAIVETPDDLAVHGLRRLLRGEREAPGGTHPRTVLPRPAAIPSPRRKPCQSSIRTHRCVSSTRSGGKPDDLLLPLRGFVAEALPDAASLIHLRDWFTVRRGFVECILFVGLARLSAWVADGENILKGVPIMQMTLRFADSAEAPEVIPAGLIRRLLLVEGLARVTGIDLMGHPVGGEGVEAILHLAERLGADQDPAHPPGKSNRRWFRPCGIDSAPGLSCLRPGPYSDDIPF